MTDIANVLTGYRLAYSKSSVFIDVQMDAVNSVGELQIIQCEKVKSIFIPQDQHIGKNCL